MRILSPMGRAIMVGSLIVGGGVGATQAAGPLAPLDAAPTFFRDVTVITMSDQGVLRNHSVLVRDGRIQSIGPAASLQPPTGAKVIEGGGKQVLTPGFADLHVHFPPAVGDEGDASWRLTTLLLCNGVTTVRGMVGQPQHIELRRRLVAGELIGPTAHMACPPLTAQSASSPDVATEAVALQKEVGFDFIKSHRVIDPEVHAAVIKAANDAGLPVTGHVDNEVGLARVLPTGQQIEHLDGYFAALLIDPSLVVKFGQVVPSGHPERFDLTRIPAIGRSIAEAKVWSGPTMALFRNLALSAEPVERWTERPELKYIRSSAKESWVKQRAGLASPGYFADADHARWFIDTRAAMLRAIRDAGGRLLACSDSPQWFLVGGFALHDELAAMVDAGLTPAEALAAATRNAAEYFAELPNRGSALGIEPDFGIIAPGKRADLVLLRANPLEQIDATRSIEAVMIRGKLLDRAELDSRLNAVERSAQEPG